MAFHAPLRRLLVVEDDPDQARALCDRLRLYGYEVSCANDGGAAIEMLQADSFDGILLDLNLPKVQGDCVLTQARRAYADLPVLILSASRSRMRAVKESQAGVCGYMLKPYSIGELKQALLSCFGPATEPVVA